MLTSDAHYHAFACTSLAITDQHKHVYHGRTLEFSSDEPESILAYYPKSHVFQRKAPDGVWALSQYAMAELKKQSLKMHQWIRYWERMTSSNCM